MRISNDRSASNYVDSVQHEYSRVVISTKISQTVLEFAYDLEKAKFAADLLVSLRSELTLTPDDLVAHPNLALIARTNHIRDTKHG